MFDINAIDENSVLWVKDENTGGLVFKYRDEIQDAFRSEFRRIFGDSINLDASSPQGQLITSLTQIVADNIAFNENLANGFFFGGVGANLDKWAWNLFRVTRKKGIPSSAVVTIIGKVNTQIPADFRISDGDLEYIISAPCIIGDSGSVSTLFEAVEIKAGASGSNTIKNIITSVLGVERVYNQNASTNAILTETDTELFNRCLDFGSVAKNASFRSILANVAEVQGVAKVAGAENWTDETKEMDGVSMPPHSVCVVALGGENKAIAEAIRNSRPTGCDMVGDTEVEFLQDDITYKYKFYRPAVVELKAEIKVKINLLTPTNWEVVLKDNLIKFIDSLKIGALITQPEINKYLYQNITNFDIIDVKFSKKSGEVGYNAVKLNLNEVASLAKNDIIATKDE